MKSAAAILPAQAGPEDFFQLLKPRVMSLVVFTAFTGMVAAPEAPHPLLAMVAVLCIAVGAGAAGALNMAFEGDIDSRMRRTRGRPVAAGRVGRQEATAFGVVLSIFSVMFLGMALNWVAAGLLALTIVYYAWFYTLVLKRRTPQNIVIGGAAGALPPVIGWAAATGTAPLDAWLLFAVIFLWTPPHSWALALYSRGDYAKAGVPMMPVVKGAAHTRLLILLYSVALVAVSALPLVTGLGGWAWGAVALGGGAMFLLLAVRVWRSRAGDDPDRADAVGREAALYQVTAGAKSARDLFAFSILWLCALFAALLWERGLAGLFA